MTNQASEDELDTVFYKYLGGTPDPDEYQDWLELKQDIQVIIRTEKLKLLDEVIHQSTANLKSAKAVAGWAELRKEQLEAEL